MVRPITRRQALLLGVVGAGGLAVGAVGLSRTGLPWLTPRPGSGPPTGGTAGAGASLVEPPTLRAAGGLLEVELRMAEAEVDLGPRTGRLLAYNGTVPGPTLRLRPGDTLRVRLVNRIDQPTNLHVHGLHVSPRDPGDNPFVHLAPGDSRDYEFLLPADHPTGTFWYHPHHHGHVADQIFGGLYGAIVVEDDLPVARDHVLVVSDVSLDDAGRVRPPTMPDRMTGREGDLVLVNGRVQPRLTAAPGETVRWRVINACVSRHLRLELAGATAALLGMDLETHAPREPGGLLLAPGNRANLLVTAGRGPVELRALPYDRGGMGMGMGMGGSPAGRDAVTLATLDVVGDDAGTSLAIPTLAAPRDLRDAVVARRRTLAFSMGMGMGMGMTFAFDGRPFDPDRTDQEVVAGAVEEWTLLNPTPMDHPFHLHVWPMQEVRANGVPHEDVRWRDVVHVPAGESRTVRIAFERFTGRTVYHCHILDHEDAGMMGVVEVRPG